MYKKVFQNFLTFRKLEICRVEVETGRRSSHVLFVKVTLSPFFCPSLLILVLKFVMLK